MWLSLLACLALFPEPAHATLPESVLRACEQAYACLRGRACRVRSSLPLPRVHAPVPGLYDSVPPDDLRMRGLHTITRVVAIDRRPGIAADPMSPAGSRARIYDLEFETTLGLYDARSRASPFTYLGGGVFKRAFSVERDAVYFHSAALNVPAGYPRFLRVPGVAHLVPGRGVPLQAYVTFLQMKRAGVAYGALRVAETYVNNERTIAELLARPAIRAWAEAHESEVVPAALVRAELPYTHTYRYLSTVLTQSGHRITRVEVELEPAAFGLPYFRIRFDLAPY